VIRDVPVKLVEPDDVLDSDLEPVRVTDPLCVLDTLDDRDCVGDPVIVLLVVTDPDNVVVPVEDAEPLELLERVPEAVDVREAAAVPVDDGESVGTVELVGVFV